METRAIASMTPQCFHGIARWSRHAVGLHPALVLSRREGFSRLGDQARSRAVRHVDPLRLPAHVSDEQGLFLSDVLPSSPPDSGSISSGRSRPFKYVP
jgi:hypothetical protein